MPRDYKDISGSNNPNFKIGASISKHAMPYNIWQNMKARCLRQSHPKYHRYGGRGITICSDWLEFEPFYKWALENGWAKGLQIDRIDNNGNYEPSNCQFLTIHANSRKKSTTKISIEQASVIRERLSRGEQAKDLAVEYGVNHGTIWFIEQNFTHVDDGLCTKALAARAANDNYRKS